MFKVSSKLTVLTLVDEPTAEYTAFNAFLAAPVRSGDKFISTWIKWTKAHSYEIQLTFIIVYLKIRQRNHTKNYDHEREKYKAG